MLGAPVGAVLLRPPVFEPGVDTVAELCGGVMPPVEPEIVLAKVFAAAAAFLGQGLPAFHGDCLLLMYSYLDIVNRIFIKISEKNTIVKRGCDTLGKIYPQKARKRSDFYANTH